MSTLPEHLRVCTRGLLRPGQRVLVAVSGGVDSMVLLEVLHELSADSGWRLSVAHLNHQLRGKSSDADERLVRRTAAKLGLRTVVERADVRRVARACKLSLEMAARKLRHDFLARTAARLRIPSIALAHQADDQLELFFLRLLRGSGGEGLAGMRRQAPSPSDPTISLVRPLLDLSKAALRGYATAKGIRFREDASNARLDIQRNRIRHELLPLLRRQYQPALERTILRVMDIVGAEAEFTADAAANWREGRGCSFDDLPVAVQRRVVQAQLRDLELEPDYALVEELRLNAGKVVSVGPAESRGAAHTGAASKTERESNRRDATSAEQKSRERSAAESSSSSEPASSSASALQWVVREAGGEVRRIANPPCEFNPAMQVVDLAVGAGEVEFGGVRVRWHTTSWRSRSVPPKPTPGREGFDADRIGGQIRLRHWRPGDRFQPIGFASEVKLQDFFTNQKVPRQRRHQLLVATTAAGGVFWVEGLRIAERFKLTRRTKRCLHWHWQRV